VIDLATGRRLETRHEDWLDAPVLPGSIAKLATLAAALERHVIEPDTRIVCERRVTLEDGRRVDCSHPPAAASLDVTEALAQSCNFFAATVARRMTRAQLSAALVRQGLSPMAPDEDPIAAALGLGRSGAPAMRLVDLLTRAIEGPPAIRNGVATAADRGTASAFARAGAQAFAKTGTSRMPSGRSLGLTVAVAPRPRPTHAVVVLVPGGSGADAAEVGATLLASLMRPHAERVRLGRARADGGYDVVPVDLEDYVAEVVAGETTNGTPSAARDAVAIAARTFALANRGRHTSDGFDVCSLTHCQVVRPADADARRAATRTQERVLRADGRIAPVFYSAECGGTLDEAAAVAGDAPSLRGMPWARARPDPAGGEEPEWRTTIDASALISALRRAGFRGAALTDLRVDANAAGRVRRVQLVGLQPASLGIDEFRRLVGHDLGWNVVRSTRFEVERTAHGFALRGRGHGHGVGLCVLGASRLANTGRSVDEILALYFPGLAATPRLPDAPVVRLQLPERSAKEHDAILSRIRQALAELTRATGETVTTLIDVIVHPTVESFGRATGREWWTSAASRLEAGRWTLDLVPLEPLMRDGRLEPTLRHELAHVVIDARLRERPMWAREGLAMHFAGDTPSPIDGPCPVDGELRRPASREAMASSYRRARGCVERALASGVNWRDVGK
jgi:SpoIID/LytB domain protein